MPDAVAAVPSFRDTVIKPLPAQRTWLDAIYQYEYVLVGGQAGPGKSYFLRWAALEFLGYCFQTLGIRGVKAGLFCEDYPTLKDRQIGKMKREMPRWLGEIKDSKEDGLHFGLNEKYGGGKLLLRNLDDPSKYASAEFAAIFVDELTKNDRQTFDDLRFRKRWPGIDHSPFVAASNPGSKGHAWVKKLWLDQDLSGEDERLSKDQFKYLPARGRDNPFLPESYWETLNSLPEKMRKAMLEGDWDLFVGQYFSDWRRDLHVCVPFSVPGHWRREISIDYGFSNPSSVGWWATDPEGHRYRYRELYGPGYTYQQLGQEVLERTPLDERIARVIADPAIWGDRPKDKEVPGASGGQQLADFFQTARGWSLVRGNHDRIPGWQRCRERMKLHDLPDGKRGTKLHIFSTCPAFIRTVPSLVHDEVKVEDVDTGGEDHCADEWRYLENTEAVRTRQEERERPYVSYASDVPANHGLGFAPPR